MVITKAWQIKGKYRMVPTRSQGRLTKKCVTPEYKALTLTLPNKLLATLLIMWTAWCFIETCGQRFTKSKDQLANQVVPSPVFSASSGQEYSYPQRTVLETEWKAGRGRGVSRVGKEVNLRQTNNLFRMQICLTSEVVVKWYWSDACLSMCGLSCGWSSSNVPSLLKASMAMATNKLQKKNKH